MKKLNQKSYTIKTLPHYIKENLSEVKMDAKYDYLNELMDSKNEE